MKEVPVTFSKDILADISVHSEALGLEDLHIGIAKREITTWMLAIHMNVG